MKHIMTIVGARPQFIKAGPISHAIRQNSHLNIKETIIHTGQHYDHNMSKTFFKDLELSTPKYNLGIANGTHGNMTGSMICKIEEIINPLKWKELILEKKKSINSKQP